MNATVARARGRYLAILNSDDWALPDRLRRQVEFLKGHPDVSLVFGVPRLVDEQGAPIGGSNVFHDPQSFADFSRRTWLRYFFFEGKNCLCAPTAMIRREAYDTVGAYDPRLTNIQDLDMWIRMLIAGHNIHVLSEELTAYRIRDDNANMSAPRLDTNLRAVFEMTKILKRFADLDTPLFHELFDEEAAESPADDIPVALRVAELARQNPRIDYQNFALEVYYERARDQEDFDRLRLLSGTLDALGLHQISDLQSLLADRERRLVIADRELRRLIGELADRDQRLVAADMDLRRLMGEVADRERRLVAADADLRRLMGELAARATKAE
jgi:hypothetical protein